MSSKSLIQSGIVLLIAIILFVNYLIFFKKNDNLVKINEANIDKNVDNKILDLSIGQPYHKFPPFVKNILVKENQKWSLCCKRSSDYFRDKYSGKLQQDYIN